MSQRKITVLDFAAKKQKGEKIVVVTAYDATFARLVHESGADALLVGDSLGMVVQGHDSTLPVTMDQMIYHCASVRRGAKEAHIIGDMPFLTFQISGDEAMRNAGRFLQDGGCDAVKLEGGVRSAEAIRRIVDAGIPVVGHIGLTPQSVNVFGGHRVQGKEEAAKERIFQDALAVEETGAYSIVLEGIPRGLAKRISEALKIPTIGIGAGIHCDGQVLVIYDLLGLDEGFNPKFLKKYDNLSDRIKRAVGAFADEVRTGRFPDDKHSFS